MAWNSLPAYIRHVQTYEFVPQLEMHLFAKFYVHIVLLIF